MEEMRSLLHKAEFQAQQGAPSHLSGRGVPPQQILLAVRLHRNHWSSETTVLFEHWRTEQ